MSAFQLPETPMAKHLRLARCWAQWNGQTGTDKQCERIMRQLDANTIERMLADRGIHVMDDGSLVCGLRRTGVS